MKEHSRVKQAITARNFTIREEWYFVWSGSLTANVRYSVTDESGAVITAEEFRYNRHPATYKFQGLRARRGTARYAALNRIADKILSDASTSGSTSGE